MTGSKITYEASGVNYEAIDPFKIQAQKYAQSTDAHLSAESFYQVAPTSRGESVFLLRGQDGRYLAHLEEGLGTKNLITQAVYETTGKSFYEAIAIDTVGTIVNDLVQLGAQPVSLAMHLAVGSSDWFTDQKRSEDLCRGWARGCELAGAVWGGGETPTLKGIVEPETFLLSGSAVGTATEEQIFRGDLQSGDRIVLLASNGVHANGLSLCRKLADQHPEGYQAPLTDGRTFGEALLDESFIYAPIIAQAQKQQLEIRYTSHITGHGWRKVMRHPAPFTYRITEVGTPQPVFSFIQKHAALSDQEMYETYNMGAGYALIIAPQAVDAILKISAENSIPAWDAGELVAAEEKSVVLEPLGITYGGESLQVRA